MKVINTKNAPAAIGPYSQCIVNGEFVFTSGQIPCVPETGEIAGDSIEVQAKTAIINLEEVLKAAGADLSTVIKTTCFLSDMKDFDKFNEIYAGYFTGKPARSCVEVSRLPKGVLCEVEAIAAIK